MPVRYFAEASSINFRRSVVYGMQSLLCIAELNLHRSGALHSKIIFEKKYSLSSYAAAMKTVALYFLFVSSALGTQSFEHRYDNYGSMIVIHSSCAMFPHPARDSGHTYNEKYYSVSTHYSDSSVAIFIPKGFRPSKKIDIVFYFHGWNNTIDSACAQFKLIEQFSASNRNTIFVFPEGPKDAPDSFGGKLEEKDTFKHLVAEVLAEVRKRTKHSAHSAGKIILAGHSGAYRVMSYILLHGGLTKNISEVYLLDALYGHTEKYSYWLDHYKGKLINIYTNDGGTKNESENLMNCLESWNIPFLKKEEQDLRASELRKYRIIFIHSALSHNEVIVERNQFQQFLSASLLSKIKR